MGWPLHAADKPDVEEPQQATNFLIRLFATPASTPRLDGTTAESAEQASLVFKALT